MKTSILLVLASCATAPVAPVTAPCPATVAPPAATPTALDEATVKQMSHALFDAFDRADAATLRDLTGPTIGLYEDQRFRDRDSMLSGLTSRADRHAPIHSRTWSDERVLLGGNTAIFIGEATEHIPAEADHQGSDDQGANTLVWVRDGVQWHAVIWQREKVPDTSWLEGRWRGKDLDAYWQKVAGVTWGVAFSGKGYEVNYIDGSPRALTSLVDGDKPQTFVQKSADDDRLVFDQVTVVRKGNGWRGEFAQPGKPVVAFDVAPADLPRVPGLEEADRAFAADTAKDGADGWARHFDEHGAMWRKGHRIEGADIKAAIAKTLAAGKLTWEPVTSGARGDLGFTVGTAAFDDEKLTYCTIWKRQKDGSWKVLFDIGQPAS
jgi:hypothetical protein